MMRQKTEPNLYEILEDYDVHVKPSWRVYQIFNNLFVIEVPRYKYSALIERSPGARGHRGLVVIYIKKELSPANKALAIEHEKTHLAQFCKEDILAAKVSRGVAARHDERMADEMEKVFAFLLKYYPPYAEGIKALHRRVRGAKGPARQRYART